ncbi:hypothetical protein [Dactylosporangium matsuzakiense]|nr:hypothetical protein [Dactylosporangium matsuzakiense]
MEESMPERPDLLVLGAGGAGAMAMLWTLAAGRRAAGGPGAAPPGDPVLGPGAMWCLPLGAHRQLALLDRLLRRRYGPGGVPVRADGSPWRPVDALDPAAVAWTGPAVETGEEWVDGAARVTVTGTWPTVLRVPAAELLEGLWAFLAAVEAIYRRAGRPPRVRVDRPAAADGPGAELVLLDDAPVVVEPLVLDHGDGRGPTAARTHLIAGVLDVPVGPLARRRVAPAFDEDHDEYRVRQVVIGRGPTGAPAWLAVQVPEYHVFDPGPAAAPGSPRSAAAVDVLVRRLFVAAAAELLGRPEAELDAAVRGGADRPRLLSATAWRPAHSALTGPVAAVRVGDAAGGGHPLHPLRAVTGPFRHGLRVRDYWRRQAAGADPRESTAVLEREVAADTAEWIDASAADFAEPPQWHFNAGCFAELAYARAHREHFAALAAGRPAPAHPAPLDEAALDEAALDEAALDGGSR